MIGYNEEKYAWWFRFFHARVDDWEKIDMVDTTNADLPYMRR
jgi:hypothetical protein